jgi:hypothetical protein
VHLPLLLLPRQVPYGLLPKPAADMLPQKVGSHLLREADLLHEVGLRALHEDLLLQGLPHGA